MSNLFNQPWTVSEQIVLLTSIIQSTGQDVPAFLVRAMDHGNIQPRWDDVALPAGRTLNACRQMYNLLRSQSRSFPGTGLPGPGFPQPQLAPYPPEVRAVSESDLPQPTQRPIQPRPPRSTDSPIPPTTNGEGFRILRPFTQPEPPGEKRRKRGRPTKEEAEERDRKLAEAGQTYEPKRRPAKKSRPSETPSSLSEALATTSPVMQTPRLQQITPKEETSSGKRRSRRQRDEGESSRQALSRSPGDESGDGRSTDAAQSPSDRLLARPERAQPATSVARDVQQIPSPHLEPQTGPKQDNPPSGPPSA
ncbi:uncharacterized protein PV07_11229 [Cladophialophora immunda]|uniref:Uncharacterized protein n=1 Tax=Cladophialophora immunda TaxID=569365 RepID=A0A0D2BVE2_9EURO|nr:uncharacterized protein PV07_11229 [Cladophialophora immunda]KIW22993.1 hypothetical protein PV07_11229 [Cladophialophora immunda]OQU93718.1 hypothetical protein CLAIMM_00195 [Cladophialophora immunda]